MQNNSVSGYTTHKRNKNWALEGMTELHLLGCDAEVILFLIFTAGFRCWESEFYLPLPSVGYIN